MGESAEDRLVAAMLLRDGRAQTEQANEDGIGGYSADRGSAKTINGRLLKGEMSQVRSYNRRCGVAPLPAPETVGISRGAGLDRAGRESAALELAFVREAHQRRQAEGAKGEEEAKPQLKRQRVGALGSVLDIARANADEARRAEEDAEMANPLMRGPASSPSKSSKAAATAAPPVANAVPEGRGARREEEEVLWPVKGLRVRVVDEDENSKFHKSHLKKGVVSQRHSAKRRVDVTLDDKKVLRDVPQSKLETVVSKTCERVEVIRGEHTGTPCRLVKRDPKRNVAIILLAGNREHALPLDDVCEFV